MAVHPVWASDNLQSVGIPIYLGQQGIYLTAQYATRGFPGQRFDAALAGGSA